MASTAASHHRRSIRLPEYDYSSDGAYFITLVVHQRELLLGTISNGEFQPGEIGKIVIDSWLWLAKQYPYVELGEYCLMPNHFHGILWIVQPVGAVREPPGLSTREQGPDSTCRAVREPPLHGDTSPIIKIKPLGSLIGAFKTVSTKHVNEFRKTPALVLWQRNYYERIIRNEAELERISLYIQNNPLQWEDDQENPKEIIR